MVSFPGVIAGIVLAVAEEGSGTAVPAGASLPDRIALGVLTRLITRELVEDVLAETGRREQRKRLLPARAVVYFVLALALFYGDSYEEVMRKLVQGLSWLAIWKREWHVPTSSALAQARERLGSEPLQVLFERVAAPCAQLSTAGAWLAGRRLMSIDGVELDAADTPANAEHFGYSTQKSGTGPYPKVLAVGAGRVRHPRHHRDRDQRRRRQRAPPRRHPRAAAREPGPRHARHGRPGPVQLQAGLRGHRRRGGLLLPCHRHAGLPALEWLPDGSYRSYIADPQVKRLTRNRSRLIKGTMKITELPGMHVRVIDYDVPGRGSGELCTIVTSVTDHQDLPAPEIAAAYHQRWEIEIAFDEIETHQRGPAAILRSRSPDMVLQELYGLLITHYAIRRLMTEAADQAELDPDRLSFTRALHIVRRQVTAQAAFSPLPPEPRHR